MRSFLFASLMGLVALGPGQSLAHPGRLNTDGCHYVRKDFTYKSGQIVRKGDVHCHRLLTGAPLAPAIILDGREVLMDDRTDVERDEPDHPEERESP